MAGVRMDRGVPRRGFLAAMTAWAGPLAVERLQGGDVPAREPDLSDQARESLLRGVTFFVRQVASHGGYVYRYSADLTKREGEGRVGMDTAWVQPPGSERSLNRILTSGSAILVSCGS